ncbi:hypothetical protein [Terracoccus sp. 273MFTsu3.1]|uniref:hypothetical protein n=1 Tax=Terracoccus sp. 273MFTsu3.1 TaxID=1172188 RepID=UPI00037B1A65|nr:hypothetical protein [Terracoccus sp. 273MFTsu3.1]
MSQFPTQHFTPTSTQDSANAWDRLADGVIGHVGTTTTPERARAAFSALDEDDKRLLLHILNNVPAMKTQHLSTALRSTMQHTSRPHAVAWKDEVAIAAQRLQDALTLVPSNVAHYAVEQARPLLRVLAKINLPGA